jgi:hypothetical protein
MWFYLLAATPFVMIALGVSLFGIVSAMLMSQTRVRARLARS